MPGVSPLLRLARLAPFALVSLLPLGGLFAAVACSSSGGNGNATSDASADAGAIDAPLGPIFCNLPVPSTCPTTAPCAASGWGCAQTACDGYFVVTDGTWVYYYSLPSGELAGEVAEGDAAFVSCPYGFVPPTCTPVVASQCAGDGGGGGGDSGGVRDSGSVGDSGGGSDRDRKSVV